MAGPRETPLSPGTVSRNKRKVRWLVLVLSCLLMVGNYYCYDNPSALHDQLKARFEPLLPEGEYEVYFNLLYTVYSVPNVILPFFGGFFVDKIGVRIMIVLFCGLVMVGQALFALGVSMNSMDVMLAGRVLFGLGGENITVGQSALVAAWFKDKELAFALGVNLSIARLGSVVNNELSPVLAEYSLDFAIWFGVLMCAMSMLTTLVLVCIDRNVDREEEAALMAMHVQSHAGYFATPRFGRPGPGGAPAPAYGLVEATPRTRRKIETELADAEQVRLQDVRHFDGAFWLLTFSCLCVYGAVLPFNNIASAFLQSKYYEVDLPAGVSADVDCTVAHTAEALVAYCADKNAAEAHAGSVMSIPYTISAILSPVLGYAVDRFGLRAVQIAAAPVILVGAHLALAWSDIDPVLPLVGMGLSYSIFAAVIWPSVPCVVEEHHTGTAYGVMTSVENIGMALFPLVVAAIKTDTGGYAGVEVFFAMLAGVGVLMGLALNVVDGRTGGRLNKVSFVPDVGPAGSAAPRRAALDAEAAALRGAAGGKPTERSRLISASP